MKSETIKKLTEGLSILSISYTDDTIKKLDQFITLYQEWNKKFNISTIVDEKDIITKHILDSLSVLPILIEFKLWNKSKKYIDLGTGGGFPGIPIKIVQPEIKLDLAEVNKKKICFLKEVSINLPLLDVNIIDSSIGKVSGEYNFLLTRAFGSLKKIALEAKKYIKKGKVIAYKGKKNKVDIEIKELPLIIQKKLSIKEINTPFLNEERHIIIMEI